MFVVVVGADVHFALRIVQAAGHRLTAEYVAVGGVLSRSDDQELGASADDEQDHRRLAALDSQANRHAYSVWRAARDQVPERGPGGQGSGLVSVIGNDLHYVQFSGAHACLDDGPAERSKRIGRAVHAGNNAANVLAVTVLMASSFYASSALRLALVPARRSGPNGPAVLLGWSLKNRCRRPRQSGLSSLAG